MTQFDVFNGDADGLCAVHQLRLAQPTEAIAITGRKRDIALLARVSAQPGDHVAVFDISLDANRSALEGLLAGGVLVEYYDHHYAGTVPDHASLVAHLDPSPDVCTAMIVDRLLQGAHRSWAIVAAFGDNLPASARLLAAGLRLDMPALEALQALGEDLAYNAYGDTEAELILAPLEMYAALRRHRDPWSFLEHEDAWKRIRAARTADLEAARAVPLRRASPRAVVAVLPETIWSRRVRGTFANELCAADPDRACAVLSPALDGSYTVSVRAARNRPHGADRLCRSFPAGGGRAGAAGINHLSATDVERFVLAFGAALG